jgi:hypothetical protein
MVVFPFSLSVPSLVSSLLYKLDVELSTSPCPSSPSHSLLVLSLATGAHCRRRYGSKPELAIMPRRSLCPPSAHYDDRARSLPFPLHKSDLKVEDNPNALIYCLNHVLN